MVFNFTENYQYTTRLGLKGKNIEVVDQKQVNKRMQLLREVQGFGDKTDDMVHLWIILCRSVLEHSCVVWGTSLIQENLERTQKTFAKIVLKEKYKNYEDALILLNLDSSETRRNQMCIKFAKKGIKNGTLNDLFQINDKKHKMKTREKINGFLS